MYKTVNFSDFCDTFRDMNRNDNFTYQGKRALFDYLEEYEDGTGEPIEFDVIALCCEYTEYDDLAELKENYGDIETIRDLEDHTAVIMVDDERLIIQNF